MITTRNPRRLIRDNGGFHVMERGKIITGEVKAFPDAFDLLRETGDYLPSFFDRVHLHHGDILEDILWAGFGLKGFKVLGEVPFPFVQPLESNPMLPQGNRSDEEWKEDYSFWCD
jgi:hypothetical protein